ncbi:MAG: hypothetical protein H0U76_23660 [Ktedonobacteraceae bacterium]|nr:hypothetical protein [Ktedonobacteraceae bacterium]
MREVGRGPPAEAGLRAVNWRLCPSDDVRQCSTITVVRTFHDVSFFGGDDYDNHKSYTGLSGGLTTPNRLIAVDHKGRHYAGLEAERLRQPQGSSLRGGGRQPQGRYAGYTQKSDW